MIHVNIYYILLDAHYIPTLCKSLLYSYKEKNEQDIFSVTLVHWNNQQVQLDRWYFIE